MDIKGNGGSDGFTLLELLVHALDYLVSRLRISKRSERRQCDDDEEKLLHYLQDVKG